MGETTKASLPIIIPRLEEPESASVDERDEHLMLLEAARNELETEFTETLAASESAHDHDVIGYPSSVAYLKHRLRISGGRGQRYVKNARAAAIFKSTFSAWKHRLISSDQAELPFRASESMPDRYPDAEAALLEIVGDDVDETKKLLDYWKQRESAPHLDLEDQLNRRRFDVTRRPNGMVAGDFELPRSSGETLLAAIDALMPPPADDDERSTSQRRADALEDLGRSFLEGSETPTVGGERPHLNIHVDLDALRGEAGGLHETDEGVVLDTEEVRTISCDASATRIVFDPEGQPIDVGRKTRVIPPAIRKAVVARDRSCVAPGCSRPPRWTDVHHIVSWADGGETSIDNLCLLCRYHHTRVHLELLDLDEVLARQVIGLRRSI